MFNNYFVILELLIIILQFLHIFRITIENILYIIFFVRGHCGQMVRIYALVCELTSLIIR